MGLLTTTIIEKKGGLLNRNEPQPVKVGVGDVLKEIPTGIKKTGRAILGGLQKMGQASLRAYAGIGGLLSGKALTPETIFQKELYGTDKPITLKSLGAEVGLGEKSKFATPVGFALGLADLIPGGKQAKTVIGTVKKAKEVVEAISPIERGFIRSVKEVVPNAAKVAGQYVPRATDDLAIKAKNLILENPIVAEKIALTRDFLI